MIMKMRDESNKERLITKERTALVVLRKNCSGKGLISNVGSDGSLGILMGRWGIIMIDDTIDGNPHWDRLDGVHQDSRGWEKGGEIFPFGCDAMNCKMTRNILCSEYQEELLSARYNSG